MLITEKGILMRTRVTEIRETGRNAAGVRLIRLDEGDRLVAMAKIEKEEEAISEGGEAAGDNGSKAEPDAKNDGNPAGNDGE